MKRSKCKFMRESSHPLFHTKSEPAPKPTSVTTLKAYLRMLTFCSKCLPKLSTLLYCLLRIGGPWRWGTKQAKAFKASKMFLIYDKCLTHH